MFERFTQDARITVANAQKHARRLGHHYIEGEHILLALVSASNPASAVLNAHGITPRYVEAEIVRRVGPGTAPPTGAGLFASLDRDALASIGIDLDAVRARIEASFGPQALARADFELPRSAMGPAGSAGSFRTRLDPRRALPPGLIRRRRRSGQRCRNRETLGAMPSRRSGPAGARDRDRAGHPPPDGPIALTPVAKKILELTLREMLELRGSSIGTEHIALALTRVKGGMVPLILAGADTTAPALHSEIADQFRQAS